jgi:hypothetical protein
MEAASTSETLVKKPIDQTARCYIPEYSHLHTRRCENLKSHPVLDFLNSLVIKLQFCSPSCFCIMQFIFTHVVLYLDGQGYILPDVLRLNL